MNVAIFRSQNTPKSNDYLTITLIDRHATPFHLCYLHFLVSPTPMMPCHMVSMTTQKIYTPFTVTRIFSRSNLHPTCNGEKSNYTLNFICENLALTVKKEIFRWSKNTPCQMGNKCQRSPIIIYIASSNGYGYFTCMRQKDKSDT